MIEKLFMVPSELGKPGQPGSIVALQKIKGKFTKLWKGSCNEDKLRKK